MKNLKILIAIVLTAFVSVTTQATNGNWGGTGTQGDPYTISDALDLALLATNVNNGNNYSGQYFQLTADISGYTGVPIGGNSAMFGGVGQSFNGIFDGNYHTIISPTIIANNSYSNVGLFGIISGGTVKNLGIVGGTIQGNSYVGGMAGYIGNKGQIINCFNTAAVTASGSVGGLVGCIENGKIIGCYNAGAVSAGSGNAVGGVVGANCYGSSIENCYNTGTVSGSDLTGGVVGFMGGNGSGDTGNQIINCYNAGAVTGDGSNTGGVLGRINNDGTNTITGCYYDNVICEKLGIGGILNQTDPPADVSGSAEGKTTAEMQTQSTFVNWDFIGVWYMPANDYPHFPWDLQPAIIGTSPVQGATDAPLDGNIVIVFNKSMDPASGTAALTEYFGGANAGSLTSGSWTNDNQRITFQYSGLDPSMSYTVAISGFKDTYGKLVTTPGSYSFTTQAGSTATHVTANAGYGGTVSNGGSGLEYTITPNSGFVIDQVFVDGVEQTEASGQSTYTVTILDDGGVHSIFATFGYTVNFNTPANGTLTVSSADANLSSGTLVHGGQILNSTAAPANGYLLESLTVNESDVTNNYNNGYAYTVGTSGAKRTLSDGTTEVSAQGADITATFTAQTYGVSIGTFTGGSVTADKAYYKEGDIVTLTILPSTNYELSAIAAYETGESTTTVDLSGSGNTRTFSMPAYGVTVTATFQKTADQTAVETAQALIEGVSNWTVAQAVANTEVAVKSWLAAQINALSGMSATGITVTEADISISGFNEAVAGTAGTPAGTNGSFGFTVSLVKGNSSSSATGTNGVITATAYVPPPSYTITISGTTNGTVTPSPASAAEGTEITLTIAPANGYELNAISAYKTGDQSSTIVLSVPNVTTRTFSMPAYGVTVTATFQKTADQLDKEAVEAAKAAIEGGSFRIAQATGNDESTVRAWLVNTLNVLFGQTYNVQFRSATEQPIVGDVAVTAITPAVAGTETTPDGINGSFKFTVTLSRNATILATGEIPGVIVATPFVAVKSIELMKPDELTVRITNTGNVATGELTLALSGANADAFTLPATTVSSLAVSEEIEIALIPQTGLSPGVYTATLTVSTEDIEPVSIEISYTVKGTDIGSVPQAKMLKAWTENEQLHVSGLTAGKLWSVYDASGLLIYQSKASGEKAKINLTVKGVYVVVSGTERVKAVYF